ncbi:hypothetical protein ADK52_25500 [Streptomyces sp. WM6372]|uniref:hypothetical protein n=1 Tax=Streptomyces sp. WM6372 TaxID=1415555 RepID=UPI0006ADF793|nr:hypothetical protein [Streptomyces sp. WM6372]KOU20946.1 hypothetical protein ADK52_25500 [Streptomyces sp. WM6372]
MNANVTEIEQPSDLEAAWAEYEVREQLIAAYEQATTRAGRAAARWEVLAYDMANPGVTKLADQLDDHASRAA